MPRSSTSLPDLLPTLGPLVCDWIETFLVHGPGDIQGQAIHLDPEFRGFIYRAYELYPRGHDQAGRRVFRRCVLSRPKGRAKSELAGMIACSEALGEVRFAGWDAHGNPVGAPITSPVIRCFATEESQAGNTYDNVQYMLSNGPVFDEYPGIDVGLTRTFLPDGGEVVAQSSSATSKDGGKDTFDVFDETHIWVTPRLRQLHGTVTRNLIKRKAADGWSLETSTMYAPGEDSVAEETHKTARAIETVLFDHKEAPLSVDISDDDDLRKALRYVYGPASEWMDIEGMISEFRDPQNRESDLRRYWLNQPWTTEEKFTTPNAWNALTNASRDPVVGAPVVLSLDGSYNNDSTALTVVTIEDPPHVAVAGCWERPADADEDWKVDILDVEETIRQCRALWDVRELTADPSRWARTLQVMEDEGMVVSVFSQTAVRMTPATSRFSDAIATGPLKGMTHSGDQRLRRHVLNAVLKNDARGKRLLKEHKKSANKIDLAVTTAMGLDRAAFYLNDEPEYATIHWGSDVPDPDAPEDDGHQYSPDGFRILTQEETTVLRTAPGYVPPE